jgi:hypothetical protein
VCRSCEEVLVAVELTIMHAMMRVLVEARILVVEVVAVPVEALRLA